jgi:hypothetical protein
MTKVIAVEPAPPTSALRIGSLGSLTSIPVKPGRG